MFFNRVSHVLFFFLFFNLIFSFLLDFIFLYLSEGLQFILLISGSAELPPPFTPHSRPLNNNNTKSGEEMRRQNSIHPDLPPSSPVKETKRG